MVGKQAKAKILFLVLMLTFYLANSYNGELREFMWPVKFGMLGIFILYVFYRVQKDRRYIDFYISFSVLSLLIIYLVASFAWLYINEEYVYDTGYSFQLAIGFALVVTFGLQMARFLSNEANIKVFEFGLVHGAAFVAFSNIILYVLGINLGRGLESAFAIRFSGWLDNPNTLGVILLGGFPFVLIAALRKQRRLVTYERVLIFSMFFLAFVTGSRSAVLGMTVMFSFILWGYSARSRALSFLILVSMLVIMLPEGNIEALSEYFPQFKRDTVDIMSGRSVAWELGWNLFLENIYFGYGFGSEKHLLEIYMPVTAEHQGANFHNSYLSLLIISGAIGALPLAVILIAGLLKSIRICFSKAQRADRFGLMASSLYLGFLSHACFETWLFSPGSVYAAIFWTICFWLLLKKKNRPTTGYSPAYRY